MKTTVTPPVLPPSSLWVCLTHRPTGCRAKTQRAALSLTFLIHASRAAQLTGQQEEAALYIRTG